jgi:uncharacterized protein
MRLLVNTAELRRVSGTERVLQGSVEPAALGIDDGRLVPGSVIDVDLHLESVNDGVIVDGTVSLSWHGVCRRCLDAVGATEVVEVSERYQHVVTDPDAFPIEHDQLDLTPLVRETVLLELPDAPLCRPDCAGLCGACGTNLNTGSCDCTTTASDPRWGALDDLRRTLDS